MFEQTPGYLSGTESVATAAPVNQDPATAAPAKVRVVPNAEDRARMAANAIATIPAISGSYGDATISRWSRFGMVDNSVMLLSTMAGFALDKKIAAHLGGSTGYGPIAGALIGNAISDGVAALPEGPKAAMSVAAGALLPLAPVAVAAYLKKPLKGKVAWAVGGTVGLLLLFSFRKTIARLF